jgi:hypothetical protein
MDFTRPARCQRQRTGREDRHSKFYEISDNLRAEWHDVVVDWVEGDAEHLPIEDASFDRVFSAFGVEFAPRHAIVARELRACAVPAAGSGS